MKIFFDSSALVKRYLEESGSDSVEKLCSKSAQIIVSVICLPEITSALNRKKREGLVSVHQYDVIKRRFLLEFEDYLSCSITARVLAFTIEILEKFPLRTLDAIHLACAIEVSPRLFVSADIKQLEAAKELKFKTQKV